MKDIRVITEFSDRTVRLLAPSVGIESVGCNFGDAWSSFIEELRRKGIHTNFWLSVGPIKQGESLPDIQV